MTVEIKIHDKTVTEIMEIVQELRKQGLVQGKDFDFSYQPPIWDNFGNKPYVRKHTVFTFYVESHATLFALKYV